MFRSNSVLMTEAIDHAPGQESHYFSALSFDELKASMCGAASRDINYRYAIIDIMT